MGDVNVLVNKVLIPGILQINEEWYIDTSLLLNGTVKDFSAKMFSIFVSLSVVCENYENSVMEYMPGDSAIKITMCPLPAK
jgi:hypothetical protein